MPATNARPVRIWSHNGKPVGLDDGAPAPHYRPWGQAGGDVQHRYANCWCFGCVAPATGEADVQLLPKLDAAHMQVFLDGVAERHQDTFTIIVLDRSGAYTAKALRPPKNIALIFRPARSPEHNPIERVWEDGRSQMVWKCFPHPECLEGEREAV